MDKHIRPKAAAELLGVSVKTVYKLVDTGQLLPLRIGTAICIPLASLTAFVRQNTKEGPDPAHAVEAQEKGREQSARPAKRRRKKATGFRFLP